jgi:hypothetical protein
MYPSGTGGKRPLSGAGDRASEIQHVSLTSGQNTLVGVNSGTMATNRGSFNTHVGANAGSSATYLQSGVLLGAKAGESATRMSNVVGAGAGVLAQAYAVYDSVMIGSGSGAYLRRSKENAFAGYESGGQLASATKTTLVGCHAGYVGKNFIETTFVGAHSGLEGNYVSGCVGVGSFAAAGIGNASNNTVIGANVAVYSAGNNNVYIGFENASNAIGSNNIFVGREAGKYARVYDSIIIGDRAGQNAVGSNVVIIGAGGSGGGNTYPTGNGSTLLGTGAGSNASGDYMTDIGYNAGRNWVGDRVSFLGASAGDSKGVGSDVVGVGAGTLDGGALGNSVTSVGAKAGYGQVGEGCVFVGSGAGASSDGDLNVGIGLGILAGVTGSQNVAVGANVTAGTNLGSSVIVGRVIDVADGTSSCVVLGSEIDATATSFSNGVYIGSNFALSAEEDRSLVISLGGKRAVVANSTAATFGANGAPYMHVDASGNVATGSAGTESIRGNADYLSLGDPSDPYFVGNTSGELSIGRSGARALVMNSNWLAIGSRTDPYFMANSVGDVRVGNTQNRVLESNTSYVSLGNSSDPYFVANSSGDVTIGVGNGRSVTSNTYWFAAGSPSNPYFMANAAGDVSIGSNVNPVITSNSTFILLGSAKDPYLLANVSGDLYVGQSKHRAMTANSTAIYVGNVFDPYFVANSKGDVVIGTSANPTIRSNTKYIGIGSSSDPYFYSTYLGEVRAGQASSTAMFANLTTFQLGSGASIMNVSTTTAEMKYPYTLIDAPTFSGSNSATDSHGTWTVASNTTLANAVTWHAFDGDSGSFYSSDTHTYYSSNSSWSPALPTTTVASTAVGGPWIQLKLPSSKKLAFVRTSDANSYTYTLTGSTDGTNFTTIASIYGDQAFGDPSGLTAYQYFRLLYSPTSPTDGQQLAIQFYEIAMSFWDTSTGSSYFKANSLDGSIQLGPSASTLYGTPSVFMLGGTTLPYIMANAAGDLLVGSGSNAVTVTKGSIYTYTGEIVAGGASSGKYANFRVYHPYRSTIFRSDASNFGLFYTANGDPLGAYTSARPFLLNYTTGNITIATGLRVSNDVQMTSGGNMIFDTTESERIFLRNFYYSIGSYTGLLTFSVATGGTYCWRSTSDASSYANIVTLSTSTGLLDFKISTANNNQICLRNSEYFLGTETGTMKFTSTTQFKWYGSSSVNAIMILKNDGSLTILGNNATKSVGGAWIGSSDARLKTNIETANVAICYETVKNLRLVRHGWIKEFDGGPDGNVLGWTAQEAREVFPKAVGSDGEYLTLDPTQIYATMYGSIQRLMQKVEALEEEVSTLRDLVRSR